MDQVVRIGCWAGAWGDSPAAARQLVDHGDLDFLVADHLAEITMALLARARAKDPDGGFVPDALAGLAPMLPTIAERGIRVITNAGGLNPRACAAAFEAAGDAAGVPLRVAWVGGDDLLTVAGGREDLTDMFTGEPLPARAMTMNAYLGARAIATALDAGAQVVVAGRCADTAVVLGPLMHAFGWRDDDHDLLSAGTLVGHVLECGPQGVGGLHTDAAAVGGWDDMGYPIAECRADGTAIISKPPGTGGLVVPQAVAEQILYEIADPSSYTVPDVVCDWRAVRVCPAGPDTVALSGARGRPPTPTYKATVTSADGWRLTTTFTVAGGDAAARARRAAHAILERGGREAQLAGHGPWTETSVEVVGGGDLLEPGADGGPGREAVVKLAARHPDRAALEVLAREVAPLALVVQGMTGLVGGRPRPAPVIRLHHVLVPKNEVTVTISSAGGLVEVPIAAGQPDGGSGATPLTDEPAVSGEGLVVVPLRRIAWARSGDKGNDVNIGVIARRPELASTVRREVSAARVAEHFGRWVHGPVERWDVPGLDAINIVLHDALGGRGGTSSLRLDPQGKSYGALALDLAVTVEERLLP